MEIIILQDGVEKFRTLVAGTAKLIELKEAIFQKLGIPVEKMVLSYVNQALEYNDLTLLEYGLKTNRETLTLSTITKPKPRLFPPLETVVEVELSESKDEDDEDTLPSPRVVSHSAEVLFMQRVANLERAKLRRIESAEKKHRFIKRLKPIEEESVKAEHATMTINFDEDEQEDHQKAREEKLKKIQELEKLEKAPKKKPIDLELALKCIEWIKTNPHLEDTTRYLYLDMISGAASLNDFFDGEDGRSGRPNEHLRLVYNSMHKQYISKYNGGWY